MYMDAEQPAVCMVVVADRGAVVGILGGGVVVQEAKDAWRADALEGVHVQRVVGVEVDVDSVVEASFRQKRQAESDREEGGTSWTHQCWNCDFVVVFLVFPLCELQFSC